eukprot:CAMPEP_0181326450 /NCGR_PEP_ID=MMETSP1101-20121128/21503_1 /TAXON_ID=46948 /ORGANISM="Rhodomonas abbreviata, Strain Caron Lab Isolate" /LENGTH=82 /DNA_ID=CAMNT_0023434901 /DNA_START=41 /DNA_END=289 /DNA_ORIENTATION=-
MFADVRRAMGDGQHRNQSEIAHVSQLWMTIEEQQRRAMDFCTSHFRTDMEAQHCIEKVMSGDVQYDDSLHYIVASTPTILGR